jgi:hypothetical protein
MATRRTRNSFIPLISLVVSKALFRGVNETIALSFRLFFDLNGLETWIVPSSVLNPPLTVRPMIGGISGGASLLLCFVAVDVALLIGRNDRPERIIKRGA